MENCTLGPLANVSRLTLGGGGIGQVWGSTDRDTAIATVRAAWEAGINLFDMAPLYGNGEAETVMGMAFGGHAPEGLKVTTKCMLGDVPAGEIEARLRSSLDESCARLQCDFVDAFILHGYVVPDDFERLERADRLTMVGVRQGRYLEHVIPVFEDLRRSGRIGTWGVTAASSQAQNFAVLDHEIRPGVVQCVSNLLDTHLGMAVGGEVPAPRAVIEAAAQRGVGVMGVRAVAAGSLTAQLDR